MSAEFHLRAVGAMLLLLAGLHALFPRWLAWREELPRLSLLNRQIFVVHTLFIVLVLALTGLLSLCMAPELIDGRLANSVCWGLAVFWGARLAVQFCVYDARLWRGSAARTVIHGCAAGVWAYFTGVYVWAALA
jgi:hypothetical protein